MTGEDRVRMVDPWNEPSPISELPKAYADILTWRDAGDSDHDIAARLGISASSVPLLVRVGEAKLVPLIASAMEVPVHRGSRFTRAPAIEIPTSSRAGTTDWTRRRRIAGASVNLAWPARRGCLCSPGAGCVVGSAVAQHPPTTAPPRSLLPGYAAVAAAAALWALAAVVARRAFDDGVNPVELTESRAVLAAVGFALLPASWRRPAASRRAAIVALGVALALVNSTYYFAVSRIPVATALVIQYTAPALIVGWTAVLARRRPAADVAAALVAALVGVVLVVDLPAGLGGRMDGAGVAAAVASAFFFASYTVLAERTGAAYGSTGAMFRGFVVAAVIWTLYQAPRGFPDELLERSNVPEVLFVGIAGTLLPFLLYAWGIRHVLAERASIAATLEPVIAAVVAWAWLGQNLAPVQVAGGLLVVAAVVALQVGRRRPLVVPE